MWEDQLGVQDRDADRDASDVADEVVVRLAGRDDGVECLARFDGLADRRGNKSPVRFGGPLPHVSPPRRSSSMSVIVVGASVWFAIVNMG